MILYGMLDMKASYGVDRIACASKCVCMSARAADVNLMQCTTCNHTCKPYLNEYCSWMPNPQS